MANKKSRIDLIALVKGFIQTNVKTFVCWVIIVGAGYGAFVIHSSQVAATINALSSPNAQIRKAEILKWANQNKLEDVLASTIDPNSTDKSSANIKSAQMREQCSSDFLAMISSKTIQADIAIPNLYALHKDPSSKVSGDSITGLKTICSESDRNLNIVIDHLADGDPDVRSASSDALTGVQNPKVIEKLVAAVKGNPPGAKDNALDTLSKIGTPATNALIGLLNSGDASFKTKIVSILGDIASPQSTKTLIDIATQQPSDPTLRRVSLLALSSVVSKTITNRRLALDKAAKSKAAIDSSAPSEADVETVKTGAPLLIDAINNLSDDSKARGQCALALGKIQTVESVRALVIALADIDTRIASFAQTGLQTIGPIAIPALSEAVKSPKEQVRAGAAYALGGIGTTEALTQMTRALTDQSVYTRRSACIALGRSNNPIAIPMLIPRLSDDDGFVAEDAASSLGTFGKQAVPMLIEALGSDNPTCPINACQALKMIGSDATDSLIATIQNGSKNQKIWCAIALGQIRDLKAKPILKETALSPDPAIKHAADESLKLFSAI